MSDQGERHGPRNGEENDWWRQLYDPDAPDAGRSPAGDTLDDRFASARHALGTTGVRGTPGGPAAGEPAVPPSRMPSSVVPDAEVPDAGRSSSGDTLDDRFASACRMLDADGSSADHSDAPVGTGEARSLPSERGGAASASVPTVDVGPWDPVMPEPENATGPSGPAEDATTGPPDPLGASRRGEPAPMEDTFAAECPAAQPGELLEPGLRLRGPAGSRGPERPDGPGDRPEPSTAEDPAAPEDGLAAARPTKPSGQPAEPDGGSGRAGGPPAALRESAGQRDRDAPHTDEVPGGPGRPDTSAPGAGKDSGGGWNTTPRAAESSAEPQDARDSVAGEHHADAGHPASRGGEPLRPGDRAGPEGDDPRIAGWRGSGPERPSSPGAGQGDGPSEEPETPRWPARPRAEADPRGGDAWRDGAAETGDTAVPEPGVLPGADTAALGDLVPDTVLDGCRHGTFTLRTVSARGGAARQRGVPRSDALLCTRFGTGEEALLLVAVATGAGRAPGARRAAHEACRLVAEAVGRSHARLTEDIVAGRRDTLRPGLQRLTDRTYGRLRTQAAALGLEPEEYTADLGCLLLPAEPGCRSRVFFGAGAGGLLVLRGGTWQDMEQHPPGGAPFRFHVVESRPGDMVLLCSAGLAVPLRSEASFAEGLAGRWSPGRGGGPPELAGFLADVQQPVPAYGDDRTAAAVWQDDAPPGR